MTDSIPKKPLKKGS